jgi:hypothetical protein
MADSRYPLEEEIAAAMARWEVQAQAQIEAWHADYDGHLQRVSRHFTDVGVDITHVWQGQGNPLREVRTSKDVDGVVIDYGIALERTRLDREWRDIERSPAYQAHLREQEPYVPTLAEQQAYEDRVYERMEARAHAGETMEEEAEEEFARQEQAFDENQLRIAAREPLSAPDVETWDEYPPISRDAIVVDASTPQMEEGFQALLAQMDARLDAAIAEAPVVAPLSPAARIAAEAAAIRQARTQEQAFDESQLRFAAREPRTPPRRGDYGYDR